ncbi:MAG: hypothetical protein ABW145_13630, partial [Candidatus Thiodiazotropha sp.]
ASNQLVMGGLGDHSPGSLDGGKLFGTPPDLRLGGSDDYGDKGRYIPTTAQDQGMPPLPNGSVWMIP